MKRILERVCRIGNEARAEALKEEISAMGIRHESLDNNMAIVIPAETEDSVVLCAHFDAVPGSFGYNDNGMSTVTILSMLKNLPKTVEVVFTNGEECGFWGAQHYLKCNRKRFHGCINLDVCGFGNMVYCDPMNSGIEPSGCKIGHMPLNDGCVFAEYGIPTLTLSTGPAEVSFREGIRLIGRTIHNGPLDNELGILNFELPALVSSCVLRTAREFDTKSYCTGHR